MGITGIVCYCVLLPVVFSALLFKNSHLISTDFDISLKMRKTRDESVFRKCCWPLYVEFIPEIYFWNALEMWIAFGVNLSLLFSPNANIRSLTNVFHSSGERGASPSMSADRLYETLQPGNSSMLCACIGGKNMPYSLMYKAQSIRPRASAPSRSTGPPMA